MVYSTHNCNRIAIDLRWRLIISVDDYKQLLHACSRESEADYSDEISRPMIWIGIYVAVASLICIIAMILDLLHAFRNKKLWFPCKYLSLNVASITVIAITMKLPVDLSGSTHDDELGKTTKLGSLAFLCVMMANLMPSLASMDNKTLKDNVAGLFILVITVIVNICIQIKTRAIDAGLYCPWIYGDYVKGAYMFIGMIILLLIITISSSISIPAFKEILEIKYQARNKIYIADQHLQNIQISTVEKLKQSVTNYWVMAETGSPQLVMTSNSLSIVSGIICIVVMVLNSIGVIIIISQKLIFYSYYLGSSYKWSIVVILLTQSIGVIVGTIAPISRCFMIFNFKSKWNRNHFMFFRVERYWTQKLNEWTQSNICFLSRYQRVRRLICNSKNIVLCICIRFQMVIIISCKVICVIVTTIPVIAISYWKSLNTRMFTQHITSVSYDANEDLTSYVLQIDNEMELSEAILKGVASTVKAFISKVEKEQNNNLLKLFDKSTGFEGVLIFDMDHVQSFPSYEFVNSWSLPIVTLTCIAISLPNIPNDAVESLLSSVGEGLLFTHIVEESLNCASEDVNLRKASMALWHEMENKCVWLDNPLSKNVFIGKTATEIVKWFAQKSEEIMNQNQEDATGELVDTTRNMLIAANSMYRATQTILLRFQSKIEPITKKQLFVHLNGIIADIFCACFINIPRVIRMKYHERVIEKREESVKVAAKLLGQTTKIIEILEKRELPNIDDEKMAYIDDWRAYFKQSIP